MVYELKEKKATRPATILGLTTLAVAGSGVFATTAEASTTHTVRSGEFLQLIGQKYGVSIDQLRQWNNLQTDVLQIGQELVVSETSSGNAGGTDSSSSNSLGTKTVTASRLNVRSGAGTNNSIIGSLSRNQTVTVTSYSNGWYTFNHNGGTGYISADYLSDQSGSSSASESTSESASSTPASGTRTVTVNRLNVRSGAGTNHSVMGGLNNNQTVEVKSLTNGWYEINHNGRTGYISARYVTEQVASANESTNTNASESTNSTPASGTRTVTASGLNVRSGAGTSHSIIGSVRQNQTVEVKSLTNGWYEINHNGRTGYISANFVTEQAAPSNPNTNNNNNNNNNNSTNNNVSSSTSFNAQSMIAYAKQFIGVPYVWGGTTPSGFDCSGFIHHVLNQQGVPGARQTVAGYWSSGRFQNVSTPQAGDLIFFQNTWRNGPSHMGIMINSTQFIHSSSSNGVTVTNVSNPYWTRHFLGFQRIQ